MKATRLFTALIALFVVAFTACDKEKNIENAHPALSVPRLPKETYPYKEQEIPQYISGSRPEFTVLDNDLATLGRVLFYDKQLSLNNSTSCSSCHNQQLAFSDGLQSSPGFANLGTPRNSPHIANLFRQSAFFWDMRESDLKTMVLKPIQNHVEMGFEKMDEVVKKVNGVGYYQELFKKAFGHSSASQEELADALTSFLSAMVSYNSKYDQGYESKFANFSANELNGYKLFTQKLNCNDCHSEPDFAPTWGSSYANIGLDMEYADKGVSFAGRGGGGVDDFLKETSGGTGQPEGFFKIPSLRNVELTAPYMHDGRFKTLEEVVEHYNSGVKNHRYLSSPLMDFQMNDQDEVTGYGPIRWNLTADEKADLIAFLKTLTDHSYKTNPMFSDPFVAVQ